MSENSQDRQGLLEDMAEEAWERFLSYAQAQHFSSGQLLVSQGATDRVLYILVEGKLEVRARGGNPEQEVCIDTFEATSVFGEQSFLDGGPRSASIVALTQGRLFRLERSDFDRLRREEPELAAALVTDIARILSLRFRLLQCFRNGLIDQGNWSPAGKAGGS